MLEAVALRPEMVQVLVSLFVNVRVPMPLVMTPLMVLPLLVPPRLSVFVVPPLVIDTAPVIRRLALVGFTIVVPFTPPDRLTALNEMAAVPLVTFAPRMKL